MQIQKLDRDITFTYHDKDGEQHAVVDHAPFQGVQIQEGEVVYTITIHKGALRVRVYGHALEWINIVPNSASEFLVRPQMWEPPKV